jgi:hypothetical protein
MVRSFGSNNYCCCLLFLLFYGVKQKDSNKSSKPKEAQSWFSKGKQLYPFGISWFDPSDPTIISDKNVEKGFREIMVFQGKTIISQRDIMVRSFGSNNCSIRRIQPWSDNQLLLFFPFFCYNKKYKQKYFVSIFVSKIYFLKRYKLYRIITKSTNKIL